VPRGGGRGGEGEEKEKEEEEKDPVRRCNKVLRNVYKCLQIDKAPYAKIPW
jgi:hypothetical protein